MKRFSENGARPVHALGGLNTPPFARLGALVFQPHNSDTLYWASLRAWTRIVGCALGFRPGDTGWENVYPEKRFARGLDGSDPTGRRAWRRSQRLRRPSTISFRFGPWLRSTSEKLPAAAQATAGSGCIRNPRADRALRLHCCRALSSQPQAHHTASTTPQPSKQKQ